MQFLDVITICKTKFQTKFNDYNFSVATTTSVFFTSLEVTVFPFYVKFISRYKFLKKITILSELSLLNKKFCRT